MGWQRAGTVTVTNNSQTVTGVGADFVSNARVGDAFVGPNGALHEITNIASATVISITPAYGGATAAGAAYSIAPIQGYVKTLADNAATIIQQWGAKLAALGDVATENVLPVAKGGTGATAAAQARTNLGLGTAATRAVGTAAGNVLEVGAGGWLGASTVETGNLNDSRQTGLYGVSGALNAPFPSLQVLSTDWGADSRWQSQFALGVSVNKALFRSILKDQTGATPWAEIYHTGNTTRAADGTLKAI